MDCLSNLLKPENALLVKRIKLLAISGSHKAICIEIKTFHCPILVPLLLSAVTVFSTII